MTRGERLKQAIEERKRSIRSFQKCLNDECVKQKVLGGSYSMVHRYLSGSNEPSAPLLACAAQVLNVNVDWLVAGKGAMTARHEIERAASRAPRRLRTVERGFQETLGVELDPIASAILMRAWRYRKEWEDGVIDVDQISAPLSPTEDVADRINDYATAHEVATVVIEPLRQLGIAHDRLTSDELTDYLIGVSQALVRVLEIGIKRAGMAAEVGHRG